MIKAVLTDIEGTTSSISFVKDVLFPYARERMADFVTQSQHTPEVQEALHEVKSLAGIELNLEASIQLLCQWIDEDRKVTPLKALQGLIWEAGYQQGDFHGHLYPDAHEGLKRWRSLGLPLYVFSSGSVKAQKLLFGHTEYGDLTPWFEGYFDTTTGPKQEPSSYMAIAEKMGRPPAHILFLSDIEGELDAAASAGLATCQLVRDPEVMASSRHARATRFDEIDLSRD
jgi:enolase-phosphatase E1